MKSIKVKLLRRITCLALVFAMLSTTAMHVSAAGVETWGVNTAVGPTEHIRVINNSWTPVKTMGRSGYLSINNFVYKCAPGYCDCKDQEPSGWSNIKVYIKIVDYDTGATLGEKTFGIHSIISDKVTTWNPVYKGQRVRIFFDVSSVNNPPGPYRRGHIDFWYSFS